MCTRYKVRSKARNGVECRQRRHYAIASWLTRTIRPKFFRAHFMRPYMGRFFRRISCAPTWDNFSGAFHVPLQGWSDSDAVANYLDIG